MSENVELEALDQLVNSPGWKIFTSVISRDWGSDEGGGAFFVTAVTKAVQQQDKDATEHLRQICAAQREIQRVLRWPQERLTLLKKASPNATSPNLSRRGNL